jgi:hypothetical protein
MHAKQAHFHGDTAIALIISYGEELQILMKSNLCICSIMNFDFCVISKKASPKTRSGRFSPRCLIVSDYVFRSMMQFELIFMYSMMY